MTTLEATAPPSYEEATHAETKVPKIFKSLENIIRVKHSKLTGILVPDGKWSFYHFDPYDPYLERDFVIREDLKAYQRGPNNYSLTGKAYPIYETDKKRECIEIHNIFPDKGVSVEKQYNQADRDCGHLNLDLSPSKRFVIVTNQSGRYYNSSYFVDLCGRCETEMRTKRFNFHDREYVVKPYKK